MTKIAIIGNAGGGKSTVARELSARLGLPLHPIDQFQWRPGWRPVPREEFAAAHASILVQDRWIIDGWGDFEFIEERFRVADTIVLIDYPLWRHYGWSLKRQFGCLFRARADGPPGCPMLPMTWPLLKMIWWIDRHSLPRLRQLLPSPSGGKAVYHIRRVSDLSRLWADVRAQAA
jgi:adenylate kinase family enzyme